MPFFAPKPMDPRVREDDEGVGRDNVSRPVEYRKGRRPKGFHSSAENIPDSNARKRKSEKNGAKFPSAPLVFHLVATNQSLILQIVDRRSDR